MILKSLLLSAVLALEVVARSLPGQELASDLTARDAADCVAKSETITSMTLKSWDIYHAMSATAHLRGTFAIFNPASSEEYQLRAIPVVEDGLWYDCIAGTSPLPKSLAICRYQLDLVYNELGFGLGWYCGQKGSGVLFNATMRGPLTISGGAELSVSSVSWK